MGLRLAERFRPHENIVLNQASLVILFLVVPATTLAVSARFIGTAKTGSSCGVRL